MNLKITSLLFGTIALAAVSPAQLIFSGYVDGTNTGGNPKAMELFATTGIPDLSAYWILRDTNGSPGGVFTESDEFQLPNVALSAGDFFYIYGTSDSETFLENLGFGDTDLGTAVLDNILNANGDDIFALSTSDDVVDAFDAFGLLGQDDTNFAQDSVAYRDTPTPSATGVLDAGDFLISAYSDTLLVNTFGTFIPEPSFTAFGIGALALLIAQRRRA
jgi:uncharacterized protein